MESWRSRVSQKPSGEGAKAAAKPKDDDDGDDDWETDPDFVNDVSEQEQRWGSKSIAGSGRASGDFTISELRKQVTEEDKSVKEKNSSDSQRDYKKGFGGQFGIEKDKKDASAVGWDYHEKVEKHSSQKDHTTGFGGKFGVQSDRVDKSAVGWDYKHTPEKHESQKGVNPNARK